LFEAISHLRQAELLYDLPPYDQGLLAFRHPLIQEVAYAMQLRSRLVRLHAAVAKAIECFDWGKLDEFAGLLAFHYEAAGQPFEAVTHLQRAARWIGRTNSAEALKSWKKARALLQDQPQSEHIDRLKALASGQILSFGYREGMSADEAKAYAEEALRYARSSDKMHEPILLGAYGRILAATAAADDYVNLVQDAVKLTSKEGDVGRFATVNAMLSQAFFMAGRLNEALDTGAVALAAIAEQGGFETNVTLGLNANQILGFDVEHWTSPVHHFMRTALQDTQIGGIRIRAGESLALFFSSGNRDEAVFPDGNLFRVDRSHNPHIAFGRGPHFCIGHQLARMEMRAIFSELLRRIERVELIGRARRAHSAFMTGITSLPVRCTFGRGRKRAIA
jgi:tetratricopeptide (TPR) repeat protein